MYRLGTAASALVYATVVLAGRLSIAEAFGIEARKSGETVMAVLTERANGRQLELSRGDVFEIRLQERPTTGFRWQIVVDGAPICTLITDRFTPPGKSLPGQAGRHAWQFRVERSGRATIELSSRRQWEPEAPPAQVFRITVIASD